MADIVGAAVTSYDLPQYVGELFQKKERPNAFLRLIGGLTGALKLVGNTEYPMGVDYELPAPAQESKLEGAAPTMRAEDTNQASNVVQIFQEGVELTYSRLGKSQSVSGVAIIPGAAGTLNNPGTLEWQLERAIERVANNANWHFLRGAYQKPANNATGRQTRGTRTAVTTNVFANGAVNRAISKSIFENALRDMMVNGAFVMGAEVFCFGDAAQLGALAALYTSDTTKPESRTVVGVSVRTIVTQWATVHLVWDPDMAAGELFITQPGYCRVVAMPIPDKGVLFVEPLAKVGSKESAQLYGELGIDYRAEHFHGVIDDLS